MARKRKHREFSLAKKQEIVKKTLAMSKSEVCRKYDISRSLLYKWEKEEWAQEIKDKRTEIAEVDRHFIHLQKKVEHGGIQIVADIDQAIELGLTKVLQLMPKVEDPEIASRIVKNLHYLRINKPAKTTSVEKDYFEVLESKIKKES